ncbi:MAG: hypothetical protein ABJB11_18520 [Ferruginibacter sp.]
MKNIHTAIAILLATVLFAGCTKNGGNPALAPINVENNKAVGASAGDLLSSAKYTSLKIEIQYMPGYAPDANAVNNLTTFINNTLNKPAGVTIVQSQVVTGGKLVLTLDDIAALEKRSRTVYTTGTQLGVYFLITDGRYTDANVLGLAFRNTSIAILGKTIHDNSGGIGQASRTKLETTVLEHELAHILGLVDIGSAMQTNHKDAAHGNHCNNSNCLMYYAAETTDITGFLLTGNIPVLDANCTADLHANGGK